MALDAAIVWEVRTGGNDNNGGGFKTGASGTDYTLQDAAQLSLTDLATSGIGVTTLTSATGGFTAAMIGNTIQIRSGTNVVAGFYEITAHTDTNTVTLDRAPDDGVGGIASGVGDVGGALASPGMACGAATVDGMRVYIKSATYTLLTDTSNVATGPLEALAQVIYEGYQTTRGDLGTKPIINAGAINTITIFDVPTIAHTSPAYVKNIKVDGQGNAAVLGFVEAERNHGFILCEAVGCTTGFNAWHVASCLADDCSVIGIVSRFASRCVAHDCQIGFRPSTSDSEAVDCLAYDNTAQGFNGQERRWQLGNCTADGNGGDGFDAINPGCKFVSCLSTNNTGWGFNLDQDDVMFGCSSYNNTAGEVDTPIMNNDEFVAVTADPYVNQAGNDYRLNDNTPGGGQIRAGAVVIPGQTVQRDAGSQQHADPAGGGGMIVHPGMDGGVNG